MPTNKFKCACGVTTRKTGASATKALFKKTKGANTNANKKKR